MLAALRFLVGYCQHDFREYYYWIVLLLRLEKCSVSDRKT